MASNNTSEIVNENVKAYNQNLYFKIAHVLEKYKDEHLRIDSFIFNCVQVFYIIYNGFIYIKINKLHESLNYAVKNNDSSARKWFSNKLPNNGWDNTLIQVLDKSKVSYTGIYIAFGDPFVFANLLGSMKGSGIVAKWARNAEDWDITLGAGKLYLIQTPEYKGTNVFKLGKTTNLIYRMLLYLQHAGVLAEFGIIILCLVEVDNTSLGESLLKKYYYNINKCQTVKGEWFRFVKPDIVEHQEICKAVQGIFVKAIECYNTTQQAEYKKKVAKAKDPKKVKKPFVSKVQIISLDSKPFYTETDKIKHLQTFILKLSFNRMYNVYSKVRSVIKNSQKRILKRSLNSMRIEFEYRQNVYEYCGYYG